MEKELYEKYVSLIKGELVPALGCTEPIAVALCSSLCAETLGTFPKKIEVYCSGNIIKNVQGVTVPNSGGLRGIEVAAILGAIAHKSEAGLEVLNSIDDSDRQKMREVLSGNICTVSLAENVDNLYIRVCMWGKENSSASATIEQAHTNVTQLVKNNEVLEEHTYSSKVKIDKSFLSFDGIFDFIQDMKISDIRDVLDRQIRFNSAIADEGLKNDWGVGAGKQLEKSYDKSDIRIKARMRAAAGSDARMAGCCLPVVINSGSGNQGMTVSIPVIEYGKYLKADSDLLYRSLTLANLIAMLQKKNLGDLSAFCGATNAAAGAAAGVAYMMGFNKQAIANTITNTICSIGGMVCDGAKSSCAYKISLALEASLFGLELGAKNGRCFQPGEGIVKKTIDETIEAVGQMASVGMQSTDKEILHIMLEK